MNKCLLQRRVALLPLSSPSTSCTPTRGCLSVRRTTCLRPLGVKRRVHPREYRFADEGANSSRPKLKRASHVSSQAAAEVPDQEVVFPELSLLRLVAGPVPLPELSGVKSHPNTTFRHPLNPSPLSGKKSGFLPPLSGQSSRYKSRNPLQRQSAVVDSRPKRPQLVRQEGVTTLPPLFPTSTTSGKSATPGYVVVKPATPSTRSRFSMDQIRSAKRKPKKDPWGRG